MSKEVYVDTYGRKHVVSKVFNSGGQGIVYTTEEPNTLLKLEWNPNTQEIVKDTCNNRKFEDIRLLPLLEKTNITLPQTILRDVAGYTMRFLDGMVSFESAFSGDGMEMPDNEWLEEMENNNSKLGVQLKKYIASGGMKKRLKSYLEVACILAKIHASGLVYCDISNKNMFVSSDLNETNVWLIDCDNLDYMINTHKKSGWKTPGFGAPEIYQGKGNTMYSDAYSFAIALFWTLSNKHPFKGNAVEEALYEEDFLDISEEEYSCSKGFSWIGDYEDNSNISTIGIPYDMFISNDLYECFQNTFCEKGRNNKQKRTLMPEWAYMLAKESDHTIRCNNCMMDYNAKNKSICPWCDSENRTMRVISYKVDDENRKIQWNFISEEKKCVDVPLRVLEGFCSNHINEKAFEIKIDNDEIEITKLCNHYEFFIICEGYIKKSIYGNTKIQNKKSFEIEAVYKKNGNHYLMKIEV